MTGEPHHYSSNLRSQHRTLFWLAIVAVVLYAAVQVLVAVTAGTPWSYLISPTLPAFYYGLHARLDRRLWRLPRFPLPTPPDISGCWVGNVRLTAGNATLRLDPITNAAGVPLTVGQDHRPVNAIVAITQTYERILVEMETSVSRSSSQIADFSGAKGGHPRLRYAYEVFPRPGKSFAAHRGLGDLNLEAGERPTLEGGYFAEEPLHKGEIFLICVGARHLSLNEYRDNAKRPQARRDPAIYIPSAAHCAPHSRASPSTSTDSAACRPNQHSGCHPRGALIAVL